jgi:hypothetical protein
MSKKWISIFVAAVITAMVMMPTAALAVCTASVVGQLTWTTAAGVKGDPVPLVPGTAVTALADGASGPTSAFPQGGGTYGKPSLNSEGNAERLADLLIYDDAGVSGATYCFNPGNVITLTYNGILTSPAVGTSLSQVSNMDAFDSAGIGGLSVTSATVSLAFAANTQQTLITITIGAKGTPAGAATTYGYVAGVGSALRLKSLRIDDTTVSGAASAAGGGTLIQVNIAQGANAVVVANPAAGADPVNTVGIKFVTNTTTGINAVTAGVAASGTQSSGAGLRGAPQTVQFTNNPAMPGGYRLAKGSCTSSTASSDTCVSQVSNDIATGDTSLVWAISGIPSGVTVTFPGKLDTTVGNGVNGFVWTARSATLTNGGAPGSLAVIYDTTTQATGTAGQSIQTADNADPGTAIGATAAANTNPNCTTSSGGVFPSNLNSGSPCNTNPKVGVLIGAQSGAGTATANVAFGPSDTSLFTGDDAATTGLIPRYSGNSAPDAQTACASSTAACVGVNATSTRYIVKSHAFFIVTPTRTVLLFPFISTVGAFNSGISIVNTCADSLGSSANSVFGSSTNNACNQTGGVTLFFFGVDPNNANAPVQVSVNTDLTQGGVAVPCRGLDASGRIAPGHGMACSIQALISGGLLGASVKGFDGYVMAVLSANDGHGFSAQFNGAGAPFAANSALILANGTGTGARATFESVGN